MELKPGMRIEILASKQFGKDTWSTYIVSNWEIPRIGTDGRWLFSAWSDYSDSPCPMIVEPERIRIEEAPNAR